jgi:hypothetical protein
MSAEQSSSEIDPSQDTPSERGHMKCRTCRDWGQILVRDTSFVGLSNVFEERRCPECVRPDELGPVVHEQVPREVL